MSYGAEKLKMGLIWTFQVKFDLEGQGRLLHKTKVFHISDPNLVILAWTGHELSRGQASDWHTHRRRQQQYLKAKTGLG